MSVKILKPGLLTTVQDQGRYGYQKYGVIASGVMDQLAYRLTNLLVGNDESSAVLEMTLIGANIEFQTDALIAIGGGDMSPTVNGNPVNNYRSIFVKKGSVLQFGPANTGCRAYVAVAGGWDVPQVMNSYSTYLRAEIGGFQGRALKKGDVLSFGSPSQQSQQLFKRLQEQSKQKNDHHIQMDWGIRSDLLPILQKNPTVRIMKGRQFDLFSEESQSKLFSEPFNVSTQSDRMGYRLQGPQLTLTEQTEMISEAVAFGTIQVPAEGQPIVLLADRQTTGGYPKIAQVATIDLPIMAQVKPGEHVYFKEISHEQSQMLSMEVERNIHHIKVNINLKIKQGV